MSSRECFSFYFGPKAGYSGVAKLCFFAVFIGLFIKHSKKVFFYLIKEKNKGFFQTKKNTEYEVEINLMFNRPKNIII